MDPILESISLGTGQDWERLRPENTTIINGGVAWVGHYVYK